MKIDKLCKNQYLWPDVKYLTEHWCYENFEKVEKIQYPNLSWKITNIEEIYYGRGNYIQYSKFQAVYNLV